ncbi:MAG: DegT/DnrJ/EryC1/StrS family aminotransferase [Planctomycetota bacterium]
MELDRAQVMQETEASKEPEGSMQDFLAAFRKHPNFAWSKINHGFWEALGKVETRYGSTLDPKDYADADVLVRRKDFHVGGFVGEFLELLRGCFERKDDALHLCFSLSAWPGDKEIIGTPWEPEEAQLALSRYEGLQSASFGGMLLKEAIHSGAMGDLFEELRKHQVLLVGPEILSGLLDFMGIEDGLHIPIHPREARSYRQETEDALVAAIEQRGGRAVVLLQAGTLAPYWILRLRDRFPEVRWIDGGLAFSISHPLDLMQRPWGKIYRREIAQFHNRVLLEHETQGCALGLEPLEEESRYGGVHVFLQRRLQSKEVADYPAAPMRFIESKSVEEARVSELLRACRQEGQWANGGPLFDTLAEAYASYVSLPEDQVFLPCANGGLALEGMARLLDAKRFGKKGDKQRWVVGDFTFKNQARGYFADSHVVDCDAQGMLSLEELVALDPETYDGFVVTNLYGVWNDFSAYADFAKKQGKAMLIDNAAGMARKLPSWPYQAFSLHHTKPYGMGEGGLAIVPKEEREQLAALFGYGELGDAHASHWVNNGKLSEMACAYHLARLETAFEWAPRYSMQALRVHHLACRAGLTPLFESHPVHAAMSLPFLVPGSLSVPGLKNPTLTFGKYYQPLTGKPQAKRLYKRIVNIPAHPDVAQVPEDVFLRELEGLVTRSLAEGDS